MSDFSVEVVRIDEAYDHPDADRLTIVKIGGYLCIANKHDDGTPRYKTGELVVYIPEGAVLPEAMMKSMDFWDVNKNKPAFRYVKAKKLRGIFSQGILYGLEPWYDSVDENGNGSFFSNCDGPAPDCFLDVSLNPNNKWDSVCVTEGDNVAEILGITKYEPVVPASMSGQMSGEYIKYAKVFDTESIQKQWNMFEDGEWVSVTEKIHGTQLIIGFVPELHDPLMFGESGSIYATSKGVGKQGFIYKNLDANAGNIYVQTLRKLLQEGLEARMQEYVRFTSAMKSTFYDSINNVETLHIMGEIFGAGVQDLAYGQKTPTVQFFDIAVNKEFLPPSSLEVICDSMLKLPRVPVLYEGPFDRKLLEELRDGKDTISGTHIREGIVIKGETNHPRYGRKVAKWVSPDYLLRKGNTTEFQ